MKIEKEDLIKLLDQKYTNEQLAAFFNCGITTIKRAKTSLNLVGYKTNSRPISIKEIEEIEALVEKGFPLQKIVEKTGKSVHLLKKYVPDALYTRIITNSRNAFSANSIKADISNIFKPNKASAYICGVLQSDGFITSDNYIGLTAKDKDFVQHFADFFSTGLREVHTDNKVYYGARFKDIRNVEKFKAVTNILPNKTYSSYIIPDWIKTNTEFMYAFITGVFNGDGWVYKLKDRNACEIGIEQHILSKKFLTDINEYLCWNTYSGDGTYRLSTKAHDKVYEFYNWFSQSEFALLRKVEVLDSVFL